MKFKRYLEGKTYASTTIHKYEREVERYTKWLVMQEITLDCSNKKDVLDYLAYAKQERNLSNPSAYRVVLRLQVYYNYLNQEHGISNPARLIKIRGIYEKKLHSLLSTEELEQLCDVYEGYIKEHIPSHQECSKYTDFDLHLESCYLALSLMCYQGLHLREVCNLNINQLDLTKATIQLHRDKQVASRSLPLEASQMGMLFQYFQKQDRLLVNKDSMEKLSKILKKLHSSFQTYKQIRASRIVIWIRAYGLRKAQYLAGHKHISATERYLSSDVDQLQKDLDMFHPLGCVLTKRSI